MKELSTEKTMTSVEVAEITEKRHDHVLRDIKKLSISYEEMGLPKIGEGSYFHKNTGEQKHRLYYLTKVQSLDLLSGYDAILRIKIIRRWEELENNISFPDFNNPAIAARAWADEFEKRVEADKALALAKPKIDLAEQFIRDKDSQYSITAVGKHLGIGQKELFRLIREKGLLTTKNLPTQKALNYGVLLEKTNLCGDGRNRKQAVMDGACALEFMKRYLAPQLKLEN